MIRNKMDDITANSPEELYNILSKIDIKVPERTKGRNSGHCEIWSICRLLSTLAYSNSLIFPLYLKHENRPDFISPDFKLTQRDNDIGIECTEAIPQELASAEALAEREEIKKPIDFSQFKWNQKKRTAKKIRELLNQDNLTGPGWGGDSYATEWVQAIFDILIEKTKKLNSGNYKSFPHYWLLIYDNLRQLYSNNDLNIAINYLLSMDKLESYWKNNKHYNSIFIETRKEIVEINCDGFQRRKTHDLWKN